MAEEVRGRVPSQSSNAGGKLPTLPTGTVDVDCAESSGIPTCFTQSDALGCALSTDFSDGLGDRALDRFSILCGCCCSSSLWVDYRYHRPALQSAASSSCRGPGEWAAHAQCRGNGGALQVPLPPRPSFEDMEFGKTAPARGGCRGI